MGNPANNTVRARVAAARQFLLWAHRNGLRVDSLYDDPAIRRLGKSYPSTYGKAQGLHPPRWLNRSEADRLIATCDTGTPAGRLDEIVIRLGLSGLRKEEIRSLNVSDLDLRTGYLRWTGKKRKARQLRLSAPLLDVLRRYLDAYDNPQPADPLVCARLRGRDTRSVIWRKRLDVEAVFRIVTGRARTAQLGHVASHDLRRSAASILHNAKTVDGGHLFDLLDVQRVLGHSDPATTMKCYLEPMDTDLLDRSADNWADSARRDGASGVRARAARINPAPGEDPRVGALLPPGDAWHTTATTRTSPSRTRHRSASLTDRTPCT